MGNLAKLISLQLAFWLRLLCDGYMAANHLRERFVPIHQSRVSGGRISLPHKRHGDSTGGVPAPSLPGKYTLMIPGLVQRSSHPSSAGPAYPSFRCDHEA